MTNNINVTLDTSVTPNLLKVHDHGHIRIDKKKNPQTITWNLTGNLAQGEFVAMTAAEPGFEWVSDPPPAAGIFDTPQVGSNGNSLQLVDNHANDDTDGTWIYRLRVSLNGTVYQTTSSAGLRDSVNNPIIINR
jgi:hypothetical protein